MTKLKNPQTRALVAVLVVLVILVVAAYGLRAIRTHSDPYVPSPEETTRHKVLYGLLAKIDAVFRRHDIKYWPVGGTMLGAVRHAGMIPWDDDIDIAVWKSDIPRAARALETELRGQIRWWSATRCCKVTPIDRYDTVVDIFPSEIVKEPEGERVVFSNESARKAWPTEFFTAEEFGGATKPLPFGPVVFAAPDRPCSYLDRVFPGWDRRGYNSEAHSESVLRKVGAVIAPAAYVFDADESRRHC